MCECVGGMCGDVCECVSNSLRETITLQKKKKIQTICRRSLELLFPFVGGHLRSTHENEGFDHVLCDEDNPKVFLHVFNELSSKQGKGIDNATRAHVLHIAQQSKTQHGPETPKHVRARRCTETRTHACA